MSAANRRRGADAERAVVAYLRANGWPDARRYLAGDGRQPGDIDAWPGVAIEVKDRAGSSWPSWCAQAVAEAGPNRVPVVVRRTRGVPDVGQWETRVRLDDWFELAESAGGTRVANVRVCPRSGVEWVVTTFARLCELVREDVTS